MSLLLDPPHYKVFVRGAEVPPCLLPCTTALERERSKTWSSQVSRRCDLRSYGPGVSVRACESHIRLWLSRRKLVDGSISRFSIAVSGENAEFRCIIIFP